METLTDQDRKDARALLDDVLLYVDEMKKESSAGYALERLFAKTFASRRDAMSADFGGWMLCCDFDGVIHSYASGWQGAAEIPDDPIPGAFEWLDSLIQAKIRVCIYSARSCQPGGIEAMQAWFEKHGYDTGQLEFPLVKPPANMTVDDRCFRFEGDYPSVDWIKRFQPWYKMGGDTNV